MFTLLQNNKKLLLSIFGLLIIIIGVGFLIYPLRASISYYFNEAIAGDIEYEEILDLEIEAEVEEEIIELEEILPEPEIVQEPAIAPVIVQAPNSAVKQNVAPVEKKLVNKVVIPKIGVDINIVEGKDDSALYKGAWHLPGTSSPDKGGNTVISAHRYLYRPPSSRTFYFLDKLAIGDSVKVYWQGTEYQYKVSEIKIVEPKQVEILYNTARPILTLFTCTPLFTSEKRLVVIAELIK